jgi:DNA-binding NarL/FixJ family response regulator
MRNIIQRWNDFEVIGEASNGLEALEMAKELIPDIILMDIAMPVMDGIQATRQISSELPSIRIIMLTTSEEENDLLNAIKVGAKGYMLKDTPSKRLHDELRRMAQGETPLSGLMATKVLKEFGRSGGSTQSSNEYQKSLTEREHQVLELIVDGLSNVEIAERVYLSENTVKKHVHNILEKFHSNNRVEAAVYAVRERLVD